MIFCEEDFQGLLAFAAEGCHAPNFTEKTFANSHKTAKFVKVFGLESSCYTIHFPYMRTFCYQHFVAQYFLLQPLLRSKYSETLIVLYGQYNNVYILDSNTLEVRSIVMEDLFLSWNGHRTPLSPLPPPPHTHTHYWYTITHYHHHS